MSDGRIICTTRLDSDLLEPLSGFRIVMPEQGDGFTFSRGEVVSLLGDTVAIINQTELKVDQELLAAAPTLKIVANIARGFDNLDLEALTRNGVWGTHVPDSFTAPTAEVTLGLLLMVTRKLAEAAAYVREGSWTSFEPGRWDGTLLEGKTLGLIGFGKIGQAVADRAKGFGLEIIYHQRSKADRSDAQWVPFDELLARSDVVSLHVPATRETRHLINDIALRTMKPGSILINTARGVVVEDDALLRAVESGHLSGAGLDVTEFEPRVADALRQHPNVVITPHLGGGTRESRRSAREHAIANVVNVLAGKPPLSPVNKID